jgi:hypothetical protein
MFMIGSAIFSRQIDTADHFAFGNLIIFLGHKVIIYVSLQRKGLCELFLQPLLLHSRH